jgi:3-methyl-2-oxobutanoate hydroxymethyltransferase
LYDLLGLQTAFKPKFVKHFAQLGEAVAGALRDYRAEVQTGTFPGDEHTYSDPGVVAPAPVGRRAQGG